MKTEIISIGSELVHGQSLDTNSRWLSQRLAEVGILPCWHTTVGDDLDDNVRAFQIAMGRARLVVATGGLGPTADDLTRSALAKVTGVDLELDPASLDAIKAIFAKRGRSMPARNEVQARFPRGAVPIPNPMGTAPGIWMELGNRTIVCLPGVPSEMFQMFDDDVLPRLRQQFGGGPAVVHRTIRCFGAGESAIEARLGDFTRRGRVPEVGITASEATISLRITATAATADEAERMIQPDADFVHRSLGDLVVGEGNAELHTVVADLLLETGLTLSTAESCTGGLVGHLLTQVSGISRCYLGGVVAYSNEAKHQLLDVPPEWICRHGAVSQEVARRMAEGCRARFGSDLAVAITGIAGPTGGTDEKPVGLVHVALAHAGGVESAVYNWAAPRESVKIRSAKTALNLVRLQLLKYRRTGRP